jgi:hypothetical protein
VLFVELVLLKNMASQNDQELIKQMSEEHKEKSILLFKLQIGNNPYYDYSLLVDILLIGAELVAHHTLRSGTCYYAKYHYIIEDVKGFISGTPYATVNECRDDIRRNLNNMNYIKTCVLKQYLQ